jgi:hypothetical protein
MNDIFKYEVLPYIGAKTSIKIRIINKEINQLILKSLKSKLKNSSLKINFDFAKTYSKYIPSSNINFFEYTFEPDKADWSNVFLTRYLSVEFLEKYIDKIQDWGIIWRYQSVPEYFIEKYFDKVVIIEDIIKFQRLTEKFLIKHMDIFTSEHFLLISIYQNLSFEFIEKYFDKFPNYEVLVRNQKVSQKILIRILNSLEYNKKTELEKQKFWSNICNFEIDFDFLNNYIFYIREIPIKKIWEYFNLTIDEIDKLQKLCEQYNYIENLKKFNSLSQH